jgi:SAM-dependent methyltransferase
LPDVNGKRVLDAGCGSGDYTAWLLEHGADIVAFDVTPDFVEITRQRFGDKATVLRADLAQPLDFAADSEFDLVICPLVMDYIEHWAAVFEEFHRVLKPSGILIFSCGHPLQDLSIVHDTNYFEVELFQMRWRGFGKPYPIVKAYRRSFGDMINPLIRVGFVVEEILEPRPTLDYLAINPREYDELMQRPGFLCIKAKKPTQ